MRKSTLFSLFLSFCLTPAVWAVSTIEILVTNADAYNADGTTVLGTFDTFGFSSANASGDIVFIGKMNLSAPDVTTQNDEGVWVKYDGDPKAYLVVREGDAEAAGRLFSRATRSPIINDAGKILIQCTLRGAATVADNYAMYSGTPGAMTLVVRKGGLAPDQTGAPTTAQFLTFGRAVLGNDATGTVAFQSTLARAILSGVTTTNNSGIWAKTAGTLKMVGREAAPLEGSIPDVPDAFLSTKFGLFYRPMVNAVGEIAFPGQLRRGSGGGTVRSLNMNFIMTGSAANSTSLTFATRGDDEAPDTSEPGYFRTFGNTMGFNSLGEVAFTGGMQNSVALEVNSTNNTGIWAGSPGSLNLVARKGDSAPDTLGASFAAFASPVLLSNEGGELAFMGRLKYEDLLVDGSNYIGLWHGDAVGQTLVARTGGSAPNYDGTPIDAGNVVFLKLYSFHFALNSYGQVVFRSMLHRKSQKYTGFQDDAIFALRKDKTTLIKIVQDGDQNFEPGKTVLRHSYVPGSGGEDGEPRAFAYGSNGIDDVGKLVYNVIFTDGSHALYLTEVD